MKQFCLIVVWLLCWGLPAAHAQTDSLLNLLEQEDTATVLLPERMMLTQGLLWGKKGLLRISGIAPLTEAARTRELKARRTMLVLHQALGYATLGGMVAQGIVGQRLYNNYSRELRNAHEGLATGITVTYFSTAALSLLAPPPMINRKKDRNSTTQWHKRLAFLHMAGMIATLALAEKASLPEYKPYHRAAAFTAFGGLAVSMVIMKF
ncbi:hypothetical protein [Rhodoflexus caldus]|uniref:hypothetical protein n=1 Tax=Rhodoflexus caldus TaxID=2891236 RepID=UPI002029BB31|nr:hypothetical protein [Rhodoflexus caldus]